MKYLDTYKIFENKKRTSYDRSYEYYTGNKAQPGFSDFLYNFFRGMNDRFKNFNNYYKQNIALTDVSGKKIDTGLGWLVGTAGDLATNVAMKIFEPQDKKPFNKLPEDPDKKDNSWWARKKESDPKDKEWLVKKSGDSPLDGSSLSLPKSDAEVTPEHMRLLNNNFIKKDLTNINTDQQMQDWVMDFYKKAGTPPGKNKVADEVAANAVGSFFSKKKGINPIAVEGAIAKAAPEIVAGAETALGADGVAGVAGAEGGLLGGLGVGEIMLALAPIGL
jgi:hypothetical protein